MQEVWGEAEHNVSNFQEENSAEKKGQLSNLPSSRKKKTQQCIHVLAISKWPLNIFVRTWINFHFRWLLWLKKWKLDQVPSNQIREMKTRPIELNRFGKY
jgi:hypothetical protein